MTERYPSFISMTGSKSGAAPSSFSGSCVASHAPIEEPIQCPTSATHQQAPLQHQLYDTITYNSMTYGNPALLTDSPIHLANLDHSPYDGALGISTGGLTSPNNDFKFTWDDPSFIPATDSLGVPLPFPPALDSAHSQVNDIPPYNQYIQRPDFWELPNSQFQPHTAYASDIPSTSEAPWMEYHSTSPFFQPGLHQVSPRTDAHPQTLYAPHSSFLSTSDESMRVPALSSGSSPSFSQHHLTPSSMSSFSLYTPDQNLRNLESTYQPPPYIADRTLSHQRPTGSLQVALRTSTMETKQPKAVSNNTLQVTGYRRIAKAPRNYVKPQKESASRPETKRVRQESKETPRTPFGPSRKSATLSLPPGTAVFTEPLTPTTIDKQSFDTSSRKNNERIISRFGVTSDAGHSIAPKVQEELCRGSVPTRAPTRAAKHTPTTGPPLSRQRRNSKDAKGGGVTSAPRRTRVRSPPAKPQNSTSQSTSTLPTLGKRQKRHTTDSNSSSNSSKTPTGPSRTNSHEDQRLTSSSSQQISDSFDERTRSVRKKPDQVYGEETGAAISAPRTELASSQRESPSRIPVLVLNKGGLTPVLGRSNPVGRTLARFGSGSTQRTGRNGPTHSSSYQAGWEATAARAINPGISSDGAQHRIPVITNQSGSMGLERAHYLHSSSAVDHENLMSTQTLPETGHFTAESDANHTCDLHDTARSGYGE